MAVLQAAAGAIHLAMAPIHAGEARREAVAFAVVGVLQLAAALLVRRREALLGGAALAAVTAAAWAWSRRWGLPFDLGGPEEAGLVDGLCAGIELVTVAVALTVAAGRWPRAWRLPHVAPFQLAVAVATVVVLAAPSTATHGGHTHATDAAAAGHDHGASATGCPEAGHPDDPVTEPPLHFDGPRLDAPHAGALDALASTSEPLPCGASAVQHSHGAATAVESPLPPDEQARFDRQWDTATEAADRYRTPDQAAAAGYVQSSPQAPGVGTHWVDWTAIDAPFDPARPSMLLYEERPGRPPRLAGFSYWTRSTPGPPDGFAGPNDVWHQHVGLCFVDGWLFRENVASKDDCGGDWLNGTDLWMLHAWVVPDLPNPNGRFAGRIEALCPGDNERIADALTCDPTGS